MPTAKELVIRALDLCGVVGVGQTAAAEDLSGGLGMLNAMLAVWSRKRWLVPRDIDLSVATTGAASYTIGPSGDINTPRPDRIEAAYLRFTASKTDYDLAVISSREDYARIVQKSISSLPSVIYYDAAYPLASIIPWPVPQAGYEIHILVKESLLAYPDQQLPPEYEEAIVYSLAARMRPRYQLPPDPSVTSLAMAALNTVREANMQVMLLRMPSGVPGALGMRYNINGDYYR